MRKQIVATLFWGVACSVMAELTLHVSPDAATNGIGSCQAPFSTLEAARDAIRTQRRSGESAIVILEDGIYRRTAAFLLEAQDSNTTWRARNQGKARVRGCMELAAKDFFPVRDTAILNRLTPSARKNVRVCQVAQTFVPLANQWHGVWGEMWGLKDGLRTSAYAHFTNSTPNAPWLFVDGQPMTLAQWPNTGYVTFTNVVCNDRNDPEKRGMFVLDDPRPKNWHFDEGVWLYGYLATDWMDENIRVGAYDKTTGTIELAVRSRGGVRCRSPKWDKRKVCFFNILEELDAPGEWYLDRKKGLLYLYPSSPLVPDSLIVLATLDEPFFNLQQTSHITIEGMVFEYKHREPAILAEKVRHVSIQGCTVANVDDVAIALSGEENRVLSCDLYNLGCGGIAVIGGDRKTLMPARNRIENNHIHHFARFQRTNAAGIDERGCGDVICHNRIHDSPHMAIFYTGNDHLIEMNDIDHVLLETGDAGVIYTGNDYASQGNVIRYNYFHDIKGGDRNIVYIDDCDSGDTVVGNVFCDIGGTAVKIGGGRDNIISNNVFIRATTVIAMDARGKTWPNYNRTNEVGWTLDKGALRFNYRQPPWSERYPNLVKWMEDDPHAPLHNPIVANVLIDCRVACDFWQLELLGYTNRLEIADNLFVRTSKAVKGETRFHTGFREIVGTDDTPVDLGFVDEKNGNFGFKQDARIFRELPVFKRLPFDKIGLYIDTWRKDRAKL